MIRSDEVLSNIPFGLTWITAWIYLGPLAGIADAVTGISLAITSAGFHFDKGRGWQKLDIWGVFVRMGGVLAILIGQWWVPGYALVLPVMASYWPVREDVNSTLHFAGWSCVIIPLLILQAGWAAIYPLTFFGIALLSKVAERRLETVRVHGAVHAIGWHVSLAIAIALIPYAVSL